MLTRLKVNGFKNLMATDVRFGPFTCLAGANGVGKSNLFDAIRFLSALSRVSLLEAAHDVRGGRMSDARELFHRVGDVYEDQMSFEAEMIVPLTAEDDLGQEATASMTFLRYKLSLGYRPSDNGLEIISESLTHINRGAADRELPFPHTKQWLDTAVTGRRSAPFISTLENPSEPNIVYLHLDRGSAGSGKPAPRLARSLPRTVLQAANAAENRTAVIARHEMQSWRLLRLEPSALREPDEFNAPTRLSEHGAHLPAMLARLANSDHDKVFAAAANRLSELIADVREVGIDRDEKRELLTLWAKGEDGTPHPARSLSEGTLRFLALAVLELDPDSQGVLCLEEPENGIHPERIPAILRLLKDIAVDTSIPVGPENPLRQVMINTHSPVVVGQVDDDDLIAVESQEVVHQQRRFQTAAFRTLPGTWRAKSVETRDLMPRNRLMSYLDPFKKLAGPVDIVPKTDKENSSSTQAMPTSRRVADRPDMQEIFDFERSQ